MLGENHRQFIRMPCHQVEHAGRYIAGIQDLVKVRGQSGNLHEGMATTRLPMAIRGARRETRASRGCSAGQTTPTIPQGSGIARCDAPKRGLMHVAVIFVCPGGVVEKPFDGSLQLPVALRLDWFLSANEPIRKFSGSDREVFSEVV